MKVLFSFFLVLTPFIANAGEFISFEANNQRVRAVLFFPQEKKDKYPLIITQHGSSPTIRIGKCSFFGGDKCAVTDSFSKKVIEEGTKSGFAVVAIDAFTELGVSKADKTQFPPAWRYAIRLKNLLSNDPRIQSGSIFYTGWSYGGASVTGVLQLNMKQPWKAVAPVEAGCQFQQIPVKQPYPILFIMGADSHYSPIPCLYLNDQLKEIGNQSEAIVIPGVSHSFSTSGDRAPANGFGAISLSGCPNNFFIIDRQGVWMRRDGSVADAKTAWSECTAPGIGGGIEDKMDLAVSYVINFFTAVNAKP